MNTRELNFWLGAEDPLIAPDHFGQIVATASDIAIVVSLKGVVETVVVNPLNQMMGKLDHWINRDLRDFLAEDSRERVEAVLDQYRSGKAEITPAVEVNHFDNAMWDFPIRYTFHLTGNNNTILMLGRDLRPIAELQQRLVKAQLALEKDYENHRDFETRYRVLLETSRDPLLLVDVASGKVTDANKSGAATLGTLPEALVGTQLSQQIKPEKAGDLMDALIDASGDESAPHIEVTSVRTGQSAALHCLMFRAAGDRHLLCRFEMDQQADASREVIDGLNTLYRDGSDGVVFTDGKGVIRSANDAFLGLCDAAALSGIAGMPIAQFLARGKIDMKVLLENAEQSGRMRIYSTQLLGQHGSKIPVEISATYLGEKMAEKFALVLRDTSRSDVHREADDPENMKNVVELVGSSPLKDIVAATTDVIEKMCIETAIELTGDNRVAVAEMLGLSRQSLYVKLRKYGLLERSGKD